MSLPPPRRALLSFLVAAIIFATTDPSADFELQNSDKSVTALAPVQVIAHGFERPTGLAIHADHDLILTDQKQGVLYRLVPTSDDLYRSEVVFAGLHDPVGVVVNGEGGLLVAETGAGRVVRFRKMGELFSAVPELVIEGPQQPRWLARETSGTLYGSASGLNQKKGLQLKPKDDFIYRLEPTGQLSIVADRFMALRGLTLNPTGVLYGAVKRRTMEEREKNKPQGLIFKVLLPDGTATDVLTPGFRPPVDLKFDTLGALFFYRAARASP